MPFGEFQYAVDDKGRVIVPPAFRDFVDDGMVVTRGMERCLFVFPLGAWQQIETNLQDLPVNDAEVRSWIRFFYSGASKAKLDSAGRITIPSNLRSFAEIEGNVVVAGAPNRLELWNDARWLQNLDGLQAQPPSPELLRGLVG